MKYLELCIALVAVLHTATTVEAFSTVRPATISTTTLARNQAVKSSQLAFSQQDTEQLEKTAQDTSDRERPDPSILVAAKPPKEQKLAIAGITAVLTLGTYLFIQFLNFWEAVLPTGWYEAWRDYTWPIPFGLIFIAAGISHFAIKETFVAFVPPLGTWGGLWQIPAPYKPDNMTYEEYHCYWTGIAEILGGLGLILAATNTLPILPVQVPAFCLFLLVAAVTPANIYMYTHDVKVPNIPYVPYPEGHYFRGFMQCGLLGFFYKMAFHL